MATDGYGSKPPSGIVTLQIDVGVPVRVVGEEHCDPELAKPPSLARLGETAAMEFKVPDETSCGFEVPILKIPIQSQGKTVTVSAYLPANATDGDLLRMCKRVDGSWRLVKATTKLTVPMRPGYKPGDEILTQAPDGSMLNLHCPAGIEAGDLVDLERQPDNTWAYLKIRKLPGVDVMPLPPFTLDGPYMALLNVLLERDVFRRLPLDQNGILHVSVPFVAGFLEFPALSNFLAEHVLPLPGVTGIHVLATELFDSYSASWAIYERWCDYTHPKIKLKCRLQDLSADPLPEVGLTLALHPEATKSGPWFGIVGSLVRSSTGLCVFTTFYEHEKQTVVNMAAMYRKNAGLTAPDAIETLENPFYKDDKPEFPPLAYFVLVEGPAFLKK